jgi:Casein kinase II regulatory subunit
MFNPSPPPPPTTTPTTTTLTTTTTAAAAAATTTVNTATTRSPSLKTTLDKPQPSTPPSTPLPPGSTTPNTMTMMTTMITPWVRRFLDQVANRNVNNQQQLSLLLPIPKDYLLDNFNLVQLAPVVPAIALLEYQQYRATSQTTTSTSASTTLCGINLFRRALQLITSDDADRDDSSMNDNHPTDNGNDDDDDDDDGVDQRLVEWAAQILYILVHQRYVVSPRGLEALRRRFLCLERVPSLYANNNNNNNVFESSKLDDNIIDDNSLVMHDDDKIQPIFGQCPRRSCCGFALLPTACSDHYQMATSSSLGARRHGSSELPSSTKTVPRLTPARPTTTTTTIPLLRYCASCGEIWNFYQTDDSSSSASSTTTSTSSTETTTPRFSSLLDWNCAWGTSVVPLFLLTYPNFLSSSSSSKNAAAATDKKEETMLSAAAAAAAEAPPLSYHDDDDDDNELRIFGFRLHPATKSRLSII